MLREETVAAGTLALIRKLSADEELSDFVLVGGTALSLQLGHRKSIDIDLFTPRQFDPDKIASHLAAFYKGEDIQVLDKTVFSYIDNVKVDMLHHDYPWIRPVQEVEGIRMASLEDISAMKLHAIVRSGSRLKDFADIYFLLETKPLNEQVEAYTAKYPDMNASMARNALLYHTDIKFGVNLQLLNRKVQWEEMANRFKEAVVEPKRVFGVRQGPRIDQPRDPEKPSQQLRKGRGR